MTNQWPTGSTNCTSMSPNLNLSRIDAVNGSGGARMSHKRGNTKTVMKHSTSVMVWGSFGANGVGNLVFIDGTMDVDKYCDILRDHLLPSAAKCVLTDSFEVLQYNDPKHTSNKAIATFQELGVSLSDHTANRLEPSRTSMGLP